MARLSSGTKSQGGPGAPDARGASDSTSGWTTLLTGMAIVAFLFWRNQNRVNPMGFDEYNLLNTALILWVPLVIILMGLRREPSDFGFCVGEQRQGFAIAIGAFLLFIPVIVYSAPAPGSQEYYLGWLGESHALIGAFWNNRIWIGGHIDWPRLAYHEAVMGFYMFGWEFFFRGYLLNGIRKISPVWVAVLIQAVFFTAMHWSKPPLEVASSFPGAILMAILALRSRSFLPCFALHWMISAGFDAAVLYYHFYPR